MKKRTIESYILLNQMAGPLFRELAEELSKVSSSVLLSTGHPDTLKYKYTIPGLEIREAPVYDRRSKIRRILSWFSYTLDSFFLLVTRKKNYAVVLVSNPPMLGPFVWLLSKLFRIPYVVIVYDIHPDILISFGVLKRSNLLVKLWKYINRKVYESAEIVVTLGRHMAETLDAQFNPGKTTYGSVLVIAPWVDESRIRPIAKTENTLAETWDQKDAVTVLYSGNMGISHDINSMLQAAKLLNDEPELKFLFIGEGHKWNEVNEFCEKNELSNTKVLPFQSEDILPYSLALADISLVALDQGAEGLMIPSKTFYYMAAGSAVIGICRDNNDLRDLVKISHAGVCIEPGYPEILANTILELVRNKDVLKQYKANARDYIEKTNTKAICTAQFIHAMEDICLLECNKHE